MKIIALDTSISDTGYAVFVNDKLKKYGCFDNRKVRDTTLRHEKTKRDVWNFIKKEKPDVVVVELTCVMRNMQTGRALERLIGIVEWCCTLGGIEYHQLRPSEWRKRTKGDGPLPKKREQLKEWSIKRVSDLYGIEVNDDISDAILIGTALLTYEH